MYRFLIFYADNTTITYDVSENDIDDEVEKLCLDDTVIDFRYRKVNADGTTFYRK